MTGAPRRDPPAARARRGAPLLAALVLMWLLLWGTWSWANVLSGLAVGLLVTLLLPLPPVDGGPAFRPVAALVFLGRFVADLVASSAQVAAQTLRPGPPHGGIVSVRARSDSDLLLTVLSEALCLVPGSIVIDLDREERVVSLHVLDLGGMADVQAQKERALAQEERIVRAFGRAADLAALDRPAGAAGPQPGGGG